jgi:Raf kinase inhibitor-like YbhB/YbcL family protein
MRFKIPSVVFALLTLAMTFGLSQASAQGFVLPNMQVTSNAFADGGIIPIKYTSHGANVQPNLAITGAPETTVSFAIIFHDIEVALGSNIDDVTHWLAWNISSPNISEGALPAGSVQGNNIRGQASYMGPGAPYSYRYHHYVFEIYALNDTLALAEGASREQLIEAMDGKVVAKTAYVGRYADAR